MPLRLNQIDERWIRLATALISLGLSVWTTWWFLQKCMNMLDPTSDSKRKARHKVGLMNLKNSDGSEITLNDYEALIAANLIEHSDIPTAWSDIGGLDETVMEIKQQVLLPFVRPDLFDGSSLHVSPKGVLLYGPPGCGKTMIAKALAKESGANFLNLELTNLFDKYIGENEKRVEAIFSLAHKLQPVIVFIDELDSFLSTRNDSSENEHMRMTKTQFMSGWDGILSDKLSNFIIIGATNRRASIDPAILRRMPCQFEIRPPDVSQREQILRLIMSREPVSDSVEACLPELARLSEGLVGSDLREVCRSAAAGRVREVLIEAGDVDQLLRSSPRDDDGAGSGRVSQLRPITGDDLISALDSYRRKRSDGKFLAHYS